MGVGNATLLRRTLQFRLKHSLPKSQVCPLQDRNTKILIKVHFVEEDTQSRGGGGLTQLDGGQQPSLSCAIHPSNCFAHLEVATSTSQFTVWGARLCILFLCLPVWADHVSTRRYLLH